MLLENKTALITGAARGIGRAIAELFASQGCNIAFTDLQINDEAEALVKQLQDKGVKAKAYEGNAADFETAHKTVEQVTIDFGRIDILVNNAGITRDGLLLRMSEQQWDSVVTVNLKSAFNFIHAITPYMMRQRSGSIILLSSVVGIGGNAGQSNYAASKAGIIGLTKSVAKELGARGIRANAIAPGFIDSDMTRSLPQNYKDAVINSIPLRRAGTIEEVASVALFLASDMSSYVTGQVIQCCGGMG